MKVMDQDYEYLAEMYQDGYFPNFLVDKLKALMLELVEYLEPEDKSVDQIQEKLDEIILKTNELQEEFEENESELETVARESIAQTVKDILSYYEIPIETEEAIRERDW